ncbi:MAG: response regulator [Candidatus Omnitrophica bacterium]|nr:response regulator [Candidatus Omnitrophota bacterium]
MEEYKVLVIEDDESAKNFLGRVIKKEGFSVLTAENGRVGVEIFEKEHPEIVISDLKMPEMSGMEVLKAIKRISPLTQVILMTAFGEVDTTIEALREGALDYIRKPIDLDILSLSLGRAKEKIAADKKLTFIPKVLVMEDDVTAQELLVKLLEKDGKHVVSAIDGEKALNIFKQEKIDIVLTDIKMPIIDGLTALHEMRKISDDFEAIIMTGYGDEASAIKAMHEGAMNYLKKPIDFENLLIFIQKAIEKLQMTRALKYRTRELELANRIIQESTTPISQ